MPRYPRVKKSHLEYLAKTRTPKESAKMREAQKKARKQMNKAFRESRRKKGY